MRLIHIVILSLLLGSCATFNDSPVGVTRVHTGNPQEVYFPPYVNCAFAAADHYYSVSASASDIAEAAHSACLREFDDYSFNVQVFFSRISMSMYSRNEAMALINDSRVTTRQAIIRRVLERRLREEPLPAPASDSIFGKLDPL